MTGEVETYSHSLTIPPSLSASLVVESLSEWDGIEETVALFKDLVITESGIL